MENMEKRSFATEVRAHIEDERPTIEGYAAIYNTRAELGPSGSGMFEEIKPGAFTAALKKDDVRALFNHDKNYPLGRLSAGTLELADDAKGLKYKIYPPDTQAGRDVVTSIKRGDITGSSFSFNTARDGDEFRSLKGGGVLRTVTNFSNIGDVGPVTYEAFEATTVSARSKEMFKAESDEPYQQEALDGEARENIEIEADARERELKLAERG